MKKRFLTLTLGLTLLTAGGLLFASRLHPAARAQVGPARAAPQVSRAVRHAKTGAVRDFVRPRAAGVTDRIKGERPRRQIRRVTNQGLPRGQNREGATHGTDAAVQDSFATNAVTREPLISAPEASFEGLSSDDNAAAFDFRVVPPDTVGDVGPNHYVQAVNLLVRVYDKSGAPLTAPFKMSHLFAPLGAPGGTTDNGDPVVLYDQAADRWLISIPSATAPFHQCIAISATSDPTGSYHLYAFQMPNNKFNDYPHFGVWPDGYYMTDHQFTDGSGFSGTGVFAFDRARMLAGDPSASYIYFDLASNDGGMLPADWDGTTAPPAGAPNLFAEFTAGEFGDPSDAMRFWAFHADFAAPANSTFTQTALVPVAAFNPTGPGGLAIEQPAPATSSNYLDAIQDRLMNRLQYRNFGTHESLVVTHTVNVGTGTSVAEHRAGVRYYEFRRVGAGNWAVNEQATFAPADGLNRWMGSAAMNGQGDLAVGYSVSSASVFPGIRYAGRLASDPPGGLFQGEATLIDGSGSQTSTSGRWGDYSSINVDPSDDCTFWYTAEYYPATSGGGWHTRVGKFKVGTCSGVVGPPPTPTPTPTPTLVNVALSSNGGVATASSTLDAGRHPSAAINGDRRGLHWGSDPATGSGWTDSTGNSFPDWIEVTFAGPRTIHEVSAFGLQNNYQSPVEPTEEMTSSTYTLTSFKVEYWTGTAWALVPGGSVTGNNKVWRKLTFNPLSTTKVRLTVNAAGSGYSRVTELEVWGELPPGPRANHALSSNGAVATATSTLEAGRHPSAAINGDRRGLHWGSDPATGSGWTDATGNSFPDRLEVAFPGPRTVDEVSVVGLQDNFQSPVEPTESQTSSTYALTSFLVEYWTGSAWAAVPGGNVTGNNKVWRKFTFSPVDTTRVRLTVSAALASYSRVVEFEAWGPAPSGPPPRVNVAASANGATATASSTLDSTRLPIAAINGDRKGLHWGSGPATDGSGWTDSTKNAFPDRLEVAFAGSKTISEVSVFGLQDSFQSPADPTEAMTSATYALQDFDVEYWTGSAWAVVPGGSVTGNDKVWRKVTFPALTTTKIRVSVKKALANYSRVVEVEAY